MAHSPTFVPQTAVPVPHLPLPDLRKIEDAYTESHIVQYTIRILLIEFVGNRLLWWEAKLRGLYRNRVLDVFMSSAAYTMRINENEP